MVLQRNSGDTILNYPLMSVFFPRIDNLHPGMLKVVLIAGDEAVIPVQGDGGDEGVNRGNGSPLLFQPPGI